MRRLPSKEEILRRAEARAMEKQMTSMDIDPITPIEEELKETGEFHEAKLELMRGPETEWQSEQRRYIDEMAGEMGLKVIGKREYAQLYKLMQKPKNHIFVKRRMKPTPKLIAEARMLLGVFPPVKPPFTVGFARMPQATPKPAPLIIRKPKRRHVARTSRTMRSTRHVKGVKVFAFPDLIWKVRSPRRKRRRR